VLRTLLARLKLTKVAGEAPMLVGAVVLAAAFGPAAAIALADGGSGGLSGLTPAATSPALTTTTPCSGSIKTTATTTGPTATTTVATTTTVGGYSDDVETITMPAATIDYFTLGFEGSTTSDIDPTAGPDAVEAALIAAVPPLQGNVTVTGTGTPGQSYTVTFDGALAGQTQPAFTALGYSSGNSTAVDDPTVDNTAPVSETQTVPTTTTETIPGTTTVKVTPACPPAPAPSTIPVPKGNPFNGRAMWIWELPSSNGGNVASIVAQAKKYGIKAVYIKSSDGTGSWSQFSKSLVTELHEAGLNVCAWQYVYGAHPVTEANLGAKAVKDGANCLIIDAESEYQGRYPAAQTYITQLRKLIGKNFPVGLAGFPYVDYHLSFPYSVFLGPNGAQYNLPQMYWADIGTTVSNVFAVTYEYNEIYRRPIFPLGQLWGKLSASSIEQFNMLANEYGATGVSWWDWQSASAAYFNDMTKTSPLLVSFVAKTPASVFRGNKGDLVIWAQEHLYSAGQKVAVDGQFGPQTQKAVKAFQAKHGLSPTGVVTGATWDALDRYTPVSVKWTRAKGVTKATIARKGKLAGHGAAEALVEPMPSWMHQVKSRDELHGEPGAGKPRKARF
jgi:hypothetical protein